MAVKVVLLPGEPIMLTRLDETFDVLQDTPDAICQMIGLLDTAPEPLFMLDDTLQLRVSFSDILAILRFATHGDKAVVRHPKLRRIVIVTTSDVIRFGTTALKQTLNGSKEVAVYTSMDEALSAIRKELARQTV
jgi:hypothetical protein